MAAPAARLLELSAERIAQEIARAEAAERQARYWQRRRRLFALPWLALYLAGLFVAYGSFHIYGDSARIAFWTGMLIGNGAILGYFFMLWHWEQA